jgi:elongation factor Ts
MAEITAAIVKSLRERTGLPMMDCKRALEETGGDQEKAVELLRKAGMKTMEKRSGRETSFGRLAVFTGANPNVGTIVELRCESAPVAGHEEFAQLANDLAKQLATGPGAKTPEELLAQPSPSQPGKKLQDQFHDLTNRIREVFRLHRMARIDGCCGSYVHHDNAKGVLLHVEGGAPAVAKDICMHIVAMRPTVTTVEELDPAKVEKEREILREAARHEGKPEKIIEKMVEGRLRNYYAEQCLLEQPFAKDPSKTVGQVAQEAGMKVLGFIHWEIGKE